MGEHAVTVREATEADAARIGSFLRAAWAESGPDAPGFAGATDEVIDEIARPDAVRARLGGPTRRMVIAVGRGGDGDIDDEVDDQVGDEVVGFAALRTIDDDATELAGIVVRRAWAGHGVGSELTRRALDLARADGAASLVVRTEVDNTAAIAFYESLDFVRHGRDVERVGDTDVAVVELVRPV